MYTVVPSRHKSLLATPYPRHFFTAHIITGKILHRLTKIYDFTHTNNIPFCNKIMIIWLNENWTFSAIESLIDWLFVYHIQVVFGKRIYILCRCTKSVQHSLYYIVVWNARYGLNSLFISSKAAAFFFARIFMYLMDEWFTQKLLA